MFSDADPRNRSGSVFPLLLGVCRLFVTFPLFPMQVQTNARMARTTATRTPTVWTSKDRTSVRAGMVTAAQD